MVKSRRSSGVFGRLYSPVHHGLYAARNVVNAGLGVVGDIVDASVKGVDKAGSAVTNRANATISNIFRKINGGKRNRTRNRTHARKNNRRTHKRRN